jgi:hypothetical protein
MDVPGCLRSNDGAVCISDFLFPFNLPCNPSTSLLPYTYYVRIFIRADGYSSYAKIDTYSDLLHLRSVAERQREFWRKGLKTDNK